MNNISATRNPGIPLLWRASMSSRELGWPSSIPNTMEIPRNPPVTWNYSGLVATSAGGPGPTLGHVAEAVIPLKLGQVFELVLQNARALNGVAEAHPWHAHGLSCFVVGRGNGIYNPETDVSTYNLVNPMFRDTVTLYPLNWIALRCVANNPGAWFFHCHILSHQVMGMGFTLVIQPDMVPEPTLLSSCPASLFYKDIDICKEPKPTKMPTRKHKKKPTRKHKKKPARKHKKKPTPKPT